MAAGLGFSRGACLPSTTGWEANRLPVGIGAFKGVAITFTLKPSLTCMAPSTGSSTASRGERQLRGLIT